MVITCIKNKISDIFFSSKENLAELLDEGFHHTNDVEKVVSEKFPEAKQVNNDFDSNFVRSTFVGCKLHIIRLSKFVSGPVIKLYF